MTDVKEFGSTTIVSGPSWTGHGFTEPKAHSFWLQFCCLSRIRDSFAAEPER